jgi:hypothetical protein
LYTITKAWLEENPESLNFLFARSAALAGASRKAGFALDGNAQALSDAAMLIGQYARLLVRYPCRCWNRVSVRHTQNVTFV